MAMMADAFPADFRAAGKRRRTQAPSDLYSAKFHAAERLRRAAPTDTQTLSLPQRIEVPPQRQVKENVPTPSTPFAHSSGSFAPSAAAFAHSSGKLPVAVSGGLDELNRLRKERNQGAAPLRAKRPRRGIFIPPQPPPAAPTAFRPDGTVDWEASVKAQRPSQTVQDAVDALHAGADALRSRGAQHITEAKDGLGWLGQRLVDAGASGVQMLGDAVLNALAPGAGRCSAILFSLIETAKENGIDPYRYLTWVLTEAPKRAAAGSVWAAELVPQHAPPQCKAISDN